MEKKSIFIAGALTIFLFSFVAFLIYVVYCFAFFDKNQNETYLNNFNSSNYEFVFKNLLDNKKIDIDDFIDTMNLMLKKEKLNEIHHLYYSDMDIDDFMNLYYFGSFIKEEDIEFYFSGKTSLFNRRNLMYKKINVKSNDLTSTIAIIHNVNLLVDFNTNLSVDGVMCKVVNRSCYFEYFIGGLHTIKYEKDGINYFGIINVYKDNQEISINNLDSLIKIEE